MTALQEKIPVLDCAEIAGTLEEIKRTASFQNFAEKLGNGVRDAGLVYLVNHDVQNEIVILTKSTQNRFQSNRLYTTVQPNTLTLLTGGGFLLKGS